MWALSPTYTSCSFLLNDTGRATRRYQYIGIPFDSPEERCLYMFYLPISQTNLGEHKCKMLTWRVPWELVERYAVATLISYLVRTRCQVLITISFNVITRLINMILLAKLKQYNPLDIASARFSFDINIFRGSLYAKFIFSLNMLDEKLLVHPQQIFGNSIKVGKSGGSGDIGYHSKPHHNSSPPHKLAAIW